MLVPVWLFFFFFFGSGNPLLAPRTLSQDTQRHPRKEVRLAQELPNTQELCVWLYTAHSNTSAFGPYHLDLTTGYKHNYELVYLSVRHRSPDMSSALLSSSSALGNFGRALRGSITLQNVLVLLRQQCARRSIALPCTRLQATVT
jgi:hypothetical protein